MNKTKIWSAGALIVLLLSGCGSQPAVQSGISSGAQQSQGQTQQAQQTQQSEGQQKQTDSSKPAMNEKERKMMMTFQSLLMMDRSQNVSITKDQANILLPIVQDGVSKKELTDDQMNKLTSALTPDQMKFLEDSENRMQNRNPAANKDASSSERKNPQSDSSGMAKPDNQGHNGGGTDGQGRPDRTNGGGQGKSGNGGPRNPGQQLAEMLQNKLK